MARVISNQPINFTENITDCLCNSKCFVQKINTSDITQFQIRGELQSYAFQDVEVLDITSYEIQNVSNGGSCNGDFQINTATNLTFPFTISFDGGLTFNYSVPSLPASFGGLCEGTYNIVVKDADNKTWSKTIVIVENVDCLTYAGSFINDLLPNNINDFLNCNINDFI